MVKIAFYFKNEQNFSCRKTNFVHFFVDVFTKM